MKIFLPIKIKPTGGTSTFAQKFKSGMEKRGHSVVFEPVEDYDALLALASCSWRYCLEARLKKKPIVQRLDGIFYPSTVSGWRYPIYNFTPKFIHRFLSSFTIYQSEYSKYCCDRFLGKAKKGRYEIIYNGVDTDTFSPDGKSKKWCSNEGQQIFYTASRFRRKDQIIPILDALEIYAQKYTSNFKFLVAGDFSREVALVPAQYKDKPWIEFLGKIPNKELPSHYRDVDVFLFTHQNPPCPNNIIEAMACSLPICGVNDGAMAELTVPGHNSELVETSGDAFYKVRKLDLEAFTANLNHIMQNLPEYKKNSRQRALEHFDLENMLDRYEQVFLRV